MALKCYQSLEYKPGDVAGTPLRLERMSNQHARPLATALSKVTPWCEVPLAEDSLYDHFSIEDQALLRFAIIYGDQCAGVISVRYPWLKGPYLELLGLLPEAQRKGLGTELINWFENEAPKLNRNYWLLCSDFNEPALKFYEKLGYEKITLIESLFAKGFHNYLMRKMLVD